MLSVPIQNHGELFNCFRVTQYAIVERSWWRDHLSAAATPLTTSELVREFTMVVKKGLCSTCKHKSPGNGFCDLYPLHLGPETLTTLHNRPCNPERFVKVFVSSYVRLYFSSFFTSRIEDLSQEILVKLLEQQSSHTLFQTPAHFRQYLAVLCRNKLLDIFRQEKGQYQCGYCIFYSKGQCMREGGESGENNPWYNEHVSYKQPPDSLKPPCLLFQSRRIDPVPYEDDPEVSPNGYSSSDQLTNLEKKEKEKIIKIVLEILADHSQQHVYLIRRLFFEQATFQQVADELNLSVRTISRERKRALELLHRKMTELGYSHLIWFIEKWMLS